MRKQFFVLLFICFSRIAAADVTLHPLISSDMVIQHNKPFTVWGWADPTEKISIQFRNKIYKTKADKNGNWKLAIKPLSPGGPFEMVVIGRNEILLKNIMVGEVWICSGQSNMEMPLQGWPKKNDLVNNWKSESVEANYPSIRFFNLEKKASQNPEQKCKGKWQVCSPETVLQCSAAAYFFGREIHLKTGMPVGLIHASWGGSTVEAWISKNTLQKKFEPLIKQYDKDVKEFKKQENLWLAKKKNSGTLASMPKTKPALSDNKAPYGLFNGMFYPLKNYSVRGVIWYQGEANISVADKYTELFKAMIKNWRKELKQGNVPFYYVQIAPWNYKNLHSEELRQAQLRALSIENVAMAVTLDIGDYNTIHPGNKQEVGKRLALCALAKEYGFKDLVFSGPIYKSHKIKDDKIILYFDHVGSGLTTVNGILEGFEIAGQDKKFVTADAVISGDCVIVSSGKNINHPLYVRYAWSNYPKASLFNKDGLPASSFKNF